MKKFSLVCPDPFPRVLAPKAIVFFGLLTNSYCGEEEEVVSELTWVAFDFLQGRVYFNNNNNKRLLTERIPGKQLQAVDNHNFVGGARWGGVPTGVHGPESLQFYKLLLLVVTGLKPLTPSKYFRSYSISLKAMGSASLLAYTQGTEKQTRSDTSKPFEKNRRSICKSGKPKNYSSVKWVN